MYYIFLYNLIKNIKISEKDDTYKKLIAKNYDKNRKLIAKKRLKKFFLAIFFYSIITQCSTKTIFRVMRRKSTRISKPLLSILSDQKTNTNSLFVKLNKKKKLIIL